MKRVISLLLMFAICISLLCGCSEKDTKDNSDENNIISDKLPEFSEYSDKMSDESNPVALIKVKDMGYMIVELYYDIAPNTVKNFISLSKSGFYNGLTFHRVMKGFMIQGGDPKGDCTGDAGYDIKGEFSNNGFENDIKHKKGTISMARGAHSYDSASSQFFIMVADNTDLDGDYAAFGYCIDGMDIADRIASVDVNPANHYKPLKDVVIESVTIVDHGIDYGEPETIM